MRSSRDSRQRPVLLILGALLGVYLIAPICAFAIRIFGERQTGFASPGLFGALGVSAISATASSAIIALLGIPLAYCLVRFKSRFATLIGLLVQLPLAIPPLMSGMLLIVLVGPYTPIGRFFHGALTETLIGVVLAQTFVAAPFLIVVVRTTFSTISDDLFDAAATLGHREFGLFFRVALPVARDGIYAGLLLAWLRAFGEYGATVILAYHPYSLPIFTYLQFSGTGLAVTVAPTALALLVAVVVVIASRIPLHSRTHRYEPVDGIRVARTFDDRPLQFSVQHRAGDFVLDLAYAGSGRRLAILGPSGSGKSMTLRALAGLFGHSTGEVRLGDELISADSVGERHTGYLPQHSALLPHLQVARQISFGVGANPRTTQYWIERLGLAEIVDQRVEELSGGQRQRVALARALSRGPHLLLLDEPFSALDSAVRREMQREMRLLQQETGLASVIVTHDFDEAALLANEVLVIENGHLIQNGSAEEIYREPANATVARLVGIENVFLGQVSAPGRLVTGEVEITFGDSNVAVGSKVWWSIHPDRVLVDVDAALRAKVIDRYFRSGNRYVLLRFSPNIDLVARLQDNGEISMDEELEISFRDIVVRVQ
ncbi:MAG TPA: ATP-binding cassette domain-containing protein [Acidimicrobiales bacterium]|nr:ATP-binding cassette domain-containing protein [Acidimicrobiales bacterium]